MSGGRFQGQTVDVVVVGSGAGGAPVALSLARAGASVVVLDKGPWYRPKDFDHDEIKNCRRDFFAPFVRDEPHVVVPKGRPARKTADGWTANCVGGGTVHMSGFAYRLHPEDTRMKTRYAGLQGANLADWPLTYEELAPWYDVAEREVGLSGRAGVNPFEPKRTGPYPLAPLGESPLAALVDAGGRAVGAHPFPTPRMILSHKRGARGACNYCDYCGSYGCETGAKGSTAVSLLPKAIATGRCEVRPRSMVFQVVERGGKATGVRYFDADGKEREQRARVVVVSATSIESARLLLMSPSSRSSGGVANAGGLVGRNLMLSTLAKGWGLWSRAKLPEDTQPGGGVHFLQRSVQDYYLLGQDAAGPYDKGGTLNYLLPHKNAIRSAERLSRRHRPKAWGATLLRDLWASYHDQAEIEFEVFGEFLPTDGTFVTLSDGARDRWNLPAAEIHLAPHPADGANSKRLVERGLALLRAAGAERTGVEEVGGTTWVLQHGTCRMGTDPSTSVLDPTCRTHEVPNLYVVDGSFMPSSTGVATTLTILANSFRVGDALAGRFKRHEH